MYNFKNNKTNFIANDIFSSKTEGRQTSLENGNMIIEETNSGIFYLLDPTGKLKYKFFIPFQSKTSLAQYPGWSRVYIKKDNRFIEQ